MIEQTYQRDGTIEIVRMRREIRQQNHINGLQTFSKVKTEWFLIWSLCPTFMIVSTLGKYV